MRRFVVRIIFVGTAAFGVPVLKKLISLEEEIVTVITQPDRPAGRGKKLQPSPIKEAAMNAGLSLYQPESINSGDSVKKIKELSPDLIVLIAYGQILSRNVLGIPVQGCLNIHPSLLPYYKGSAPVQWTIIRGEKETGISFLFMSEKIDSGDIILQKKVNILPGENYLELSNRLSIQSAEMLPDILDSLKKGNYKKYSQAEGEYFYARKICKDDCRIDWSKTGKDIFNLIRGIAYIPCAYTEFKGKRIKITKASLVTLENTNHIKQSQRPGDIIDVSKKGIQVLTGDDDSIVIKRLILPGSKEMDVSQFINGYKITVEDSFEY